MLSIQELRNLRDEELMDELKKARRECFEIRAGVRTKKIKAIHKLKLVKRYIARILTIMKEFALEKLQKAGAIEVK